jgi:cytochrome c oxidase subunit 3
MPPVSDHVETERKPKLGGGGPGKIPHRRGYGGGDDGDRGRGKDPFSRNARLRRYRIGMAMGIASVTMIFIGLTTAYLVRQNAKHWDPALQHEIYDWKPVPLPYGQLWINSLLLAVSSLTIEMGRRGMAKKAEFAQMGIMPPRSRGDLPWLSFTVLLGMAFLAGQVLVWTVLRHQGLYLRANPSSSFFYLLTGLHALHLAGGLTALLYAACGSWLRLRFETRWIAVEVTAWYWHFMGLLWFAIFALLHFAKG